MKKQEHFCRKKFTFHELVIVIATLTVFSALLLPAMAAKSSAMQTVSCAGNLKNLLQAAQRYVSDYDGFWPCPGKVNTAGTYVMALAKGKYLDLPSAESELNKLVSPLIQCPSIPFNPDVTNTVQAYATPFNNRNGKGFKVNDSGFATGREKASSSAAVVNKNVNPEERIWLADGMTAKKSRQFQSVKLCTWNGSSDASYLYPVHEGGRQISAPWRETSGQYLRVSFPTFTPA